MRTDGSKDEQARRAWRARVGAARPRLSSVPMVSRTVTLPEDLVERLLALEDGNLSAGIGRMAEVQAGAATYETRCLAQNLLAGLDHKPGRGHHP
jgi:hypothetical protein